MLLIHYYAGEGSIDKLRTLLTQTPGYLEAKTDRTGSTPLHLAARAGNADVVDLLLSYNADVRAQNYNKYTPLGVALYGLRFAASPEEKCGFKLVIQQLLIRDMSVLQFQEKGGVTPETYANAFPELRKQLRLIIKEINSKQGDNHGKRSIFSYPLRFFASVHRTLLTSSSTSLEAPHIKIE